MFFRFIFSMQLLKLSNSNSPGETHFSVHTLRVNKVIPALTISWFNSGACDGYEMISVNTIIVFFLAVYADLPAASTVWVLRKVRLDENGDNFKIKAYFKDSDMYNFFHSASIILDWWSLNQYIKPDQCIVTPIVAKQPVVTPGS